MMLAHLAPACFQRELRTHLARGTMNAGDVVMTWNAAPPPADVNVPSDYAPEDLRSVVLRALIHVVSVNAAQSHYTMFEQGDAIVTFDGEHLDLQHRRGVTFLLPDGHLYTQKSSDRDPVEFWSVFVGGRPLSRTLLLRRHGDRIRLGQVYLVQDGRRTLLYLYSLGARRFTPIGDTTQASIHDGQADLVTIAIGGETVLSATPAGVEVTGEIVALGGSALADDPRLEFWVGSVRCASLSAARLAVADVLESGAAPTGGRNMAMGLDEWMFSFTGHRAVAPEFIEGADNQPTTPDEDGERLLLWGLFPLPLR